MNIEQCRYFSEIIQSGSYRIAAQKLSISEECIKESINSLENELGFQLVMHKCDCRVGPSFEGLQIITLVDDLFKDYQELEDMIKSLKKNAIVNYNGMYDVSILLMQKTWHSLKKIT